MPQPALTLTEAPDAEGEVVDEVWEPLDSGDGSGFGDGGGDDGYQPPVAQGDPGDECQSCKRFFESHGKPPKRLIAIPGKFTDFGVQIVVCPHCDGLPILAMNGLDENGDPLENS